MIKKLVKWLQHTLPWVSAMKSYRKSEYDIFFAKLEEIERVRQLTPYQLGVKANALLLAGRYKESLSTFTILSAAKPVDNADIKYIAAYSRAMIADINGNRDEFDRIARSAVSIPAKRIIKRNLPLGLASSSNSTNIRSYKAAKG